MVTPPFFSEPHSTDRSRIIKSGTGWVQLVNDSNGLTFHPSPVKMLYI